jgi:hypothetical protein
MANRAAFPEDFATIMFVMFLCTESAFVLWTLCSSRGFCRQTPSYAVDFLVSPDGGLTPRLNLKPGSNHVIAQSPPLSYTPRR